MSKIRLERILDCDTDRLYGPLDKIIEYLQEVQAIHPEAELEEHWYGYEDMEMRFVYFSEETDDEYTRRLESEKRTREWKEAKKKEEEDRKNSAYQAALKKLNKEFGK